MLGEVDFNLPKSATRKARHVRQSLRAARVTLKAPYRNDRALPDLEVSAILAQEDNPPKGTEPVQWLLLTSLPVDSFEPAVEKLAWYLCRWEIEIFFRILKSGCTVERLQLETVERLETAIALYMIIAWRVQQLTMLGRRCPELPCDVVFEIEEWQAIYLVAKRAPPPEQPPTLDQVVRMIASFGGFLNRKGDGFPGPKTLWIGLQRNRDFVLALHAQKALTNGTYV